MTITASETELDDRFPQFATAASDVRFSYSKPDDRLLRRLVVRGIERFSGQPKLQRMYLDWAAHPTSGENIFAAAMRLMKVKVNCDEAALMAAPKQGPLLIIANHPFGVVDGLAIMAMATRLRPDVKMLVHSVLCQPPELKNYLLPIDFAGTADARNTSATTRRRTVEWLAHGHCVVIFPAGGVATAQQPFTGKAVDAPWHEFVSRLTRVANLKILPVFFEGQNSRLFQIASHISFNLRLALVFRESARRIGGTISAKIGTAIEAASLPHKAGKKAVMQHLRHATYALGGEDGSNEYIWPKYVKVD